MIDRLSPELALVDDALASDARLRLCVPEDILVLAPVVRLVPAPLETADEPAVEELASEVLGADADELGAGEAHLRTVPTDVGAWHEVADVALEDEELPDFLILPESGIPAFAIAEVPVLVESAPTDVSEEDIDGVAETATLVEELPDFLVVPEDEARGDAIYVPAPDEPLATGVEHEELAPASVEAGLPDYLVLPGAEENGTSDGASSRYPALPVPDPQLDATDETDAALRLIRERFTVEPTTKRKRFRRRFVVASGVAAAVAAAVVAIDVQLGLVHLPGLG